MMPEFLNSLFQSLLFSICVIAIFVIIAFIILVIKQSCRRILGRRILRATRSKSWNLRP